MTEQLSNHQVFLGTDTPITAEALAESLLGLSGVVRNSGEVVRLLIGTSRRVQTEVYIQSFEVGSYKENILLRVILGKGRKLEENLDKIRQKMKLDTMTPGRLIMIVAGLCVLYVAYQQLKPGDPASVHIENSFNNFGGELHLSRDEMIALVDGAINNKKDLKKSVVKFVHPAGDIRTNELKNDNDDKLTIPREAIQIIPSKYEREADEEPLHLQPRRHRPQSMAPGPAVF